MLICFNILSLNSINLRISQVTFDTIRDGIDVFNAVARPEGLSFPQPRQGRTKREMLLKRNLKFSRKRRRTRHSKNHAKIITKHNNSKIPHTQIHYQISPIQSPITIGAKKVPSNRTPRKFREFQSVQKYFRIPQKNSE